MLFKKDWVNHWTSFLFFLGAFVFDPVLTYAKKVDRSSKPVSLDNRNLTHLRDSPMARGIQEGFCTAIKNPHLCPECVENFMGARLYREVLNNSFLLVDSESNGFGGYFMLAVFKAHRKVYRLWVYKLSSGEFQVREMTPYITLNKVLMDELSRSDYSPYWLNGCTGQDSDKSRATSGSRRSVTEEGEKVARAK